MIAGRTITLASQLGEIGRVVGLVEEFAAEHGLPDFVVFDVNLALDEVLTNIISYAYDDTGEHTVTVRLLLDDAALHVEVEDDGRPFDPLTVPEPDLSGPVAERPIGGLGLHLVRKLMTSLAYARKDGRNVLALTRTLQR